MKEHYYDMDVERNILKAILQSKDFCSSVITNNRVLGEHFTDQFHKDTWKAIKLYFSKYGKTPTRKHVPAKMMGKTEGESRSDHVCYFH